MITIQDDLRTYLTTFEQDVNQTKEKKNFLKMWHFMGRLRMKYKQIIQQLGENEKRVLRNNKNDLSKDLQNEVLSELKKINRKIQ